MKLLKTLGALTVLTGLLVGMAPQASLCKMSQKRTFACEMPCCKKGAPSCPMIQKAAPQDLISVSSSRISPVLKVVAVLAFRDYVAVIQPSPVLNTPKHVPKLDPCSTPQSIPAPPVLA